MPSTDIDQIIEQTSTTTPYAFKMTLEVDASYSLSIPTAAQCYAELNNTGTTIQGPITDIEGNGEWVKMSGVSVEGEEDIGGRRTGQSAYYGTSTLLILAMLAY